MKYLITTVDGKERTHDLNSRNEEALFEQLLNSKICQMVLIRDEFGYVTVYNKGNIVSVSSLEPMKKPLRAML